MTTIPFTKMVGTGNDFIIVDAVRRSFNGLAHRWAAVSRTLCDRHQGIGSDGVLLLEPSAAADVTMRVFNPDGSEASMCGNGARCVALYLVSARRRGAQAPVRIATRAGILQAVVRGERVAMRMTDPVDLRLRQSILVNSQAVHFGFVNTGVPHAVVPVSRLDRVEVARLGRAIRFHRAFAPQGANVNFVQATAGGSSAIRIRTYERGVEDETLACGTGVAASAIVHTLMRKTAQGARHRIAVETRSGDELTVSFAMIAGSHGPRVTHVVLEGAARRVFNGSAEWPLRRGHG